MGQCYLEPQCPGPRKFEGLAGLVYLLGREQDNRLRGDGKKADYILALKGNQGTLREDVELFANEQKTRGFADATVSVDETIDGDHGRIETRRVTVVHDLAWLRRATYPARRRVLPG
jgi:predicted transposase YbfD/YdcC